VKIEATQTAIVQGPTVTETPATRDTQVRMVATEYGVRFVEPESPDRSRILLGLASFGPSIAHVTQTVLVATTHLLSVESAGREPGGASGARSDKTPSDHDRPRARWSCLRRRPDLEKVGS
jgi:hypothetical protein